MSQEALLLRRQRLVLHSARQRSLLAARAQALRSPLVWLELLLPLLPRGGPIRAVKRWFQGSS
jgi:hypothetical protein